MIIADRSKEPTFKTVEEINFPDAEKTVLKNGTIAWLLKSGTQKIVRLEFIFKAGRWFETEKLMASLTNIMLNEGTKNHTSKELALLFDYYGSFISFYAEADRAGFILFSLSKYLEASIKLVKDILENSNFPEKELKILINNKKQEFLINQSKVSYLSGKRFMQAIFRNGHPYGKKTEISDFDKINRNTLFGHYENCYRNREVNILASGYWDFDLPAMLDQYFGQKDFKPVVENKSHPEITKKTEKETIIIKKPDALQSSLRIGKAAINRTHPDYAGLKVLSTLLGGYFGSRLMKNIREEKGYTYGISAYLVSNEHAGYFVIGSEVGSEVCQKAMDEIFHEIRLLREKPVDKKELSLVKNYLLGSWLRMFDGPLATAETLRVLMDYDYDKTYWENSVETIRNITPEQLTGLAIRYFEENSFTAVVAGKC
jgi:predicted Zn-dependent peptidase